MTVPLPPLLLRGDCMAELARIPDESVDAVVTDPPYGLANTDPAHVVEALTRWAQGDRDFIPSGRGFMGKEWDAFVPPPAVWDECARILKPGGHLLAFAGSRTFDLMTLSIRFAGFEIRDSIAWLYGSGFPKSLDVSKAIDKLDAAAVRLERAREFQTWLRRYLTPKQINEATGTDMGHHLTTHPTQPAVATAAIFDMLRPLLPEVPEAIEALVAERTVESENYARRGSTGVHEKVAGVSEWRAKYEGGKVAPVAEKKDVAHTPEAEAWQGWGTALKPAFEPVVVARKPLIGTVAANVIEHGTGALNIDATRIAGESTMRSNRAEMGYHGGNLAAEYTTGSDAGRWPANVALDESQAAALDEQSGTTKGKRAKTKRSPDTGSRQAFGAFAGQAEVEIGYDDEGGASRFFYVAKAPKSERPVVDGTAHPTVKPLAIMRWLIRLVTPPGGVVVDPFAGSGTTLEAAYLEGFEAIGVEMTPEYWPLVAARIERVTK